MTNQNVILCKAKWNFVVMNQRRTPVSRLVISPQTQASKSANGLLGAFFVATPAWAKPSVAAVVPALVFMRRPEWVL
jgi:hypothetical protein